MHTKPDLKTSVEDIGDRLALTRRALDLTRFQMAQLLGTDMPTWGTYEDGLVRIPPDEALKLAPHGIPSGRTSVDSGSSRDRTILSQTRVCDY
jgi:transcriptional regulator with XRE-family HTH domain